MSSARRQGQDILLQLEEELVLPVEVQVVVLLASLLQTLPLSPLH